MVWLTLSIHHFLLNSQKISKSHVVTLNLLYGEWVVEVLVKSLKSKRTVCNYWAPCLSHMKNISPPELPTTTEVIS